MTTQMQRPSGGCDCCGGPVRTYTTGIGWMCSKCIREERYVLDRHVSPTALARRAQR
jgi:hypothetical protein